MTEIELGPQPETRRRHPWRRVAAAAALVVVGLAVFVLVWFQPQKLFIDDEVDQAIPTATTEAPAQDPASADPAAPPAGPTTSPPTTVPPEPVDLATGGFVSLDHGTAGTVRVLQLADGRRFVRLEGFETENGPDLFVYLSANPAGGPEGAFDDDYLDLGRLQGNIGDQNYEIPADLDLAAYRERRHLVRPLRLGVRRRRPRRRLIRGAAAPTREAGSRGTVGAVLACSGRLWVDERRGESWGSRARTARGFLAGMGALGAATTLGRGGSTWPLCGAQPADVPPVDPEFPLGVAAGDPREDGSVIWTAVPPRADGAEVRVGWEVAHDPSFRRIVCDGRERATAATGYTVHTTVRDLRPDSWYHYRFHTPTGTSRVGRLRTAPRPGRHHDRLRFAFSSCQQINDSPYVAHQAMAGEDLDFWVHYGDYVYVHDTATLTLDDYRGVYRRFKANPLLQHLHATYPVVAMWDDGEFANGMDRNFEPARFAAAAQAWFEHQPVRSKRRDPTRRTGRSSGAIWPRSCCSTAPVP